MSSFKPNDPVIAPRFAGPPLMDAVFVKDGTTTIQAMTGESESIRTITVRFPDGTEVDVDASNVLPGGPNYAVRTPLGEAWCESADEIAAAIGDYMNSDEEQKSLAKVAVVLMPPDQRTGVGTELNPSDFYV